MKNTFITMCLLLTVFCSCNSNKSDDKTKMADSTTSSVNSTAATEDSLAIAGTNDSINMSMTAAANDNTVAESETVKGTNSTKAKGTKHVAMAGMPNEPTSTTKLNISSTAFANGGVIPVKYTCDGEGATPPLNFGTLPAGTKSYALIVHDYNAYPDRGFTYWIIWNLDTSGFIPENFRSSHETMNAAKQYGYTPICSKSGDHKYHFIVYALDTRLVLGRNTTKEMIERVMKNHILGKGDLVGVYNRRLE